MARTGFLALLILALLAPVSSFAQETCVPGDTRLCLNGNRFRVEVDWALPGVGPGVGHAVPLTADTGLFWFFQESNLELVVKVLDGRRINGHFWVYYGALSNVEYTLTITDTKTGVREMYHNPAGLLSSGSDTRAFERERQPARLIQAGMLGEAAGPEAEAAPVTLPVPQPRGPELRVNETTRGMQRDPDVATGSDGGSMVVWTGDSSPANGLDAYGRLYDRAGKPRSGEFPLSSTREGDQWDARIAAGSSGGYMTVWQNGYYTLFARFFGNDGRPLGGETQINPSPNAQLLAGIAADPSGGYLAVWRDTGNQLLSAPPAIRAQRFDAAGNKVGGEVTVIAGSEGEEVSVAAGPGGFVVSWIQAAGFFQTDVWARRLDASGQPTGPAFRVSEQNGVPIPGRNQAPVPVFHQDGGFSVLWQTAVYPSIPANPGLFVRRYGPGGLPQGAVLELRDLRYGDSTPPAVTRLPSGEVLVLWFEYENLTGDPSGGLLGRLYDPSWQPLGAEFRVNTYTQDVQTAPAVAVDGTGGLFAVWQSGVDYLQFEPPSGYGEGTQDGSFFGVFGQRFTATACTLNPDQLCLGGRFRVEARFTSPYSGKSEAAHALPLTGDTGAFWFFNDSNVELVIKVLDGRARNGHFWFYSGALSDVEYTIVVTDTETGEQKSYYNPPGRLASRADTRAF